MMRTCLTLFTGFIILFGCQNSDTGNSLPASDTSSKIQPEQAKTDARIPYSGLWVNEQYVNAVKASRSPVNIEIPLQSCVVIPGRTLQSFHFIAGFHEGSEELVIVQNGNSYEIWNQDQTVKKDSIQSISPDKIRIGKDEFIKIRELETNEAHQYKILEILLFKGSYSDEQGNSVEFDTDGQVTGLPGYSQYAAPVDYGEGSADVNIITLNDKEFGFKFISDQLLIYEIKCLEYDSEGKTCTKAGYGKLFKTLTKKSR